jgi:hypothetical protein
VDRGELVWLLAGGRLHRYRGEPSSKLPSPRARR